MPEVTTPQTQVQTAPPGPPPRRPVKAGKKKMVKRRKNPMVTIIQTSPYQKKSMTYLRKASSKKVKKLTKNMKIL